MVTLTKLQLGVATLAHLNSAALSPAAQADLQAKRARALAAVARARVANAWLRAGSCAIVVLVAGSLLGALLPGLWFAGLILVLIIDYTVYKRLLVACEAGRPPSDLRGIIAWTVIQSAYGNVLAAMLWFAPYMPGETLAVIYLCGGLANAAATLRSSATLSIAGAGPTIGFLLGLPIAEYFIGGAQNTLDLMPLVGGFLLLGFCVNLWRSLLASDAAQAQAEAAVLRERQSASAAAAAKSDMIRRMNNELRTPMTALIGAAEHLRRAAATPQARAHIGTLVQAGEVLKLVLDDLSDLDRLENGKLPIEPQATDMRELLRSVMSAFRAAAQDKNLELFLDVAPSVPQRVVIDGLRVRQVLFNLLANAVRYTTHGGVRVTVTAQPSGQGVDLGFIIADTGAGMSRSQLALVFGRERLSAQGEGPGLGLAISLRLVRLMGGRLTAKSELGQGSVFSFGLNAPVAAAARSNAA